MKKFIKIAKGTVAVGMISGAGAATIGAMGGSTAGINTMSSMMPAAIGASMGGAILGPIMKLHRGVKKWEKRRR